MVYFGIFIYTLINSFLSLARDFQKQIALFFIFVFIFLIVSLRYASVDYFSYWNLYDYVTSFSDLSLLNYKAVNTWTSGIESGFAVLILLEKMIMGDYFFFIFLFSSISLFIKYCAFKKFSPYIILSALLYLSQYMWKDMGQIRNAMVSGIMLWSAWFSYKRQPIRFSISILFAISIHHVAVLGIPLYFIPYISKSIPLMWVVLLVSFGIACVGGLGYLLPEIAARFGFDQTSSRVIQYAMYRGIGEEGYRKFGGTFFLYFFIAFGMLYFYNSLIKKWEYNRIMIPMYIYGTVLVFLFFDYGVIASRTNELLCLPSMTVILPSFLLLFKKRERSIPYIVIVFYCSVLFIIAVTKWAPPYQSILQFLL